MNTTVLIESEIYGSIYGSLYGMDPMKYAMNESYCYIITPNAFVSEIISNMFFFNIG